LEVVGACGSDRVVKNCYILPVVKQLLQETYQYVNAGVLIGNFQGVPNLIWNHELQMLNCFRAVF
jgi:hypothetical protein